MQQRTQVAAVAAVLGILTGVVSASGQFVRALFAGSPSSIWLVLVGTSVLAVLVSPVAVFALGYVSGRRNDVAAVWTEIALTVGLAGGVAFLVTYVTAVAAGVGVSRDLLTAAAAGTFNAVVRTVDFAITSLAGAAVAHFRSG